MAHKVCQTPKIWSTIFFLDTNKSHSKLNIMYQKINIHFEIKFIQFFLNNIFLNYYYRAFSELTVDLTITM